MRKLILLALGIAALELLKRRSQQQGPSSVLLGAAERGRNWFRRPQKAGKAVQPAQPAQED